jgi:hypothetical protein
MRTDTSGAQVFMDWIHHLVHQKKLFAFHHENTNFDISGPINILIVTGSKELHFVGEAEALNGQVSIAIFEDTTTSDDGTEIASSAFHRGTKVPLLSKVYHTPSITADGTQFVTRRILASATGANRVSSALRPGAERVFKANSKYLIRFTAVADNLFLTVDCTIYEP